MLYLWYLWPTFLLFGLSSLDQKKQMGDRTGAFVAAARSAGVLAKSSRSAIAEGDKSWILKIAPVNKSITLPLPRIISEYISIDYSCSWRCLSFLHVILTEVIEVVCEHAAWLYFWLDAVLQFLHCGWRTSTKGPILLHFRVLQPPKWLSASCSILRNSMLQTSSGVNDKGDPHQSHCASTVSCSQSVQHCKNVE